MSIALPACVCRPLRARVSHVPVRWLTRVFFSSVCQGVRLAARGLLLGPPPARAVKLAGCLFFLPTLARDPDQLPLLSRLWDRQRENREKSLTCSSCGDNSHSWWHCSDPGCWISLCARCYSRYLHPYSSTYVLPDPKAPGGHLLGQKYSCAHFDKNSAGIGLADRLKPGCPCDLSHVLRPFTKLSVMGFGSDELQGAVSAVDYSSRNDLYELGAGNYPLTLRFSAGDDHASVATRFGKLCRVVAEINAQSLVLDLRVPLRLATPSIV